MIRQQLLLLLALGEVSPRRQLELVQVPHVIGPTSLSISSKPTAVVIFKTHPALRTLLLPS